jgi:hypothetical protein
MSSVVCRVRGWKRKALAAAAVVSMAGAALGAAPSIERAFATDGTPGTGGTFTYKQALPTACPLAIICATGTFTGAINGTFTNTITTLLPSAVPGVSYFSGLIAVTTPSGNLNCSLAGALNAFGKDGEFGEICVITGGTGTYTGATGHLRMTGMSSSQLLILGQTGSGDYQAKLVLT